MHIEFDTTYYILLVLATIVTGWFYRDWHMLGTMPSGCLISSLPIIVSLIINFFTVGFLPSLIYLFTVLVIMIINHFVLYLLYILLIENSYIRFTISLILSIWLLIRMFMAQF